MKVVLAAAVLIAVTSCGDAVEPDTHAPTVSVTISPCCLVTIPGTQISVEATAADNVGVAYVEFLARTPAQPTAVRFAVDSSAPYTATYPPGGFVVGSDGAYEISAKAYDAAGNAGTSTSALTVGMDVTAPNVTLAIPAGRVTSRVPLSLTINASEPLARVEVYDGTELVASAIDPVLPKQLFTNISASQNGTRVFTARGWDRAGNAADTPPDTVIVDIRWIWDTNPSPTMQLHSVTTTGAFIYASGGTRNGFPDAVLVKLDSTGGTVWTRTFGLPDVTEEAQSVTYDGNGNVYVGVGKLPLGFANRDCILVKYSDAGQELMTRIIDTGGNEQNCHVAVAEGGTIYVAGYLAADPPQIFLARYDTAGNFAWLRLVDTLFGSGPTEFAGIAVDSGGAIYVSGAGREPAGGGAIKRSLFIAKLDAEGNRIWKRFIAQDADIFGAITIDSAANVFVTGANSTEGPLVAKYDSSGTPVWRAHFGPASSVHPQALTVDAQGTYLTGYTYSSIPGLYPDYAGDVVLAHFDPGGTLTDLRTFAAQGPEEGYGVAADGTGVVYVCGWLRNYQLGVVLKYRP